MGWFKALLRGDLSASNLRLGIGVRDLHDGAALQVEGNIHPATTESYNLGSSSIDFQSVYLKIELIFLVIILLHLMMTMIPLR